MGGLVAADYIVFGVLMFMSAAIGIFYSLVGGRQKTTKEYLLANRQMGLVPIALSLLVSFQSAIMILGYTAEIYLHGVIFWMTNVGVAIAIFLTGLAIVPFYRPLNLTSSFEYLERRFQSKAVSRVGSFMGLLGGILYMGTATYAPSTAVEAVTGFPLWMSILIASIVSTFYTSIGGMKAVLWTDVFQFLVMEAGIFAVLGKGLSVAGGIENVWNTVHDGGRMEVLILDPNPTTRHTFWGVVIGSAFTWFGVYATNQASIQRISTAKSKTQARWAVFLNIPGLLSLSIPVCLLGMIVYTYYTQLACDPMQSQENINSGNQMLSLFVSQIFESNPGVSGLFLATLFSGALSSNSSTMNGSAAIIWEDYFKPHFGHWPDWKQTLFTKTVVVIVGVLGMLVAFLCMTVGGPVTQISLSFGGATAGPLAGLFLLGGLFPWANWIGACAGALSSFGLLFWISIGAYVTKIKSYNPPVEPVPISGCHFTAENVTFDNVTSYMTSYMTSTGALETTSMGYLNGTESHGAEYTLTGLEYLYAISYMWYGCIGILLTLLVGMIVSLITGPTHPSDVEELYILPGYRRLFYGKSSKMLDFEKSDEICVGKKYEDVMLETFIERDSQDKSRKDSG
ncbi:sodium-coupled monocarboxylate transporter 1 isoform X2 [Lingula anatina]|uniref:Sodium-coupled monocarboxylate transporter 1 isoform X2 n=1 Tax=Lingula anatina TaxID=7574 RepID=A0A1S3KCC8_LINAN|nr:sodium-coupled monocarboxylate transporter 1 isoform X2 [Lingula anatina]|eukprot:XP_013420288.1 sodium-coupled monocarboxylate transporter 1 isoform X2 [Lingula anatina]